MALTASAARGMRFFEVGTASPFVLRGLVPRIPLWRA